MSRKRPLAITLAACFWVIIALLILGYGGLAIFALNFAREQPGELGAVIGAPPKAEILASLTAEAYATVAVCIAITAFIITVVYALLRLRPWARKTIQVLNWVCLAYLLSSVVMNVYFVAVNPMWFWIMKWTFVLYLLMLIWCAWIIKGLKEPDIRKLFVEGSRP